MSAGLNGHESVPNRLNRWERATDPMDPEQHAWGLDLGRRKRLERTPPRRDPEPLMVAFCAVLLVVLVSLFALQVALGP